MSSSYASSKFVLVEFLNVQSGIIHPRLSLGCSFALWHAIFMLQMYWPDVFLFCCIFACSCVQQVFAEQCLMDYFPG